MESLLLIIIYENWWLSVIPLSVKPSLENGDVILNEVGMYSREIDELTFISWSILYRLW